MQADRFHEIIHGVNHERMMGNASFRCARGFPSMREGGIAFVSRRNVDKRFIGPEAFVAVDLDSLDPIQYYGEHKPSVDTPVQVRLYRYYERVRYMIHSHTYVEGAYFTREPVPCGAVEEFELIREIAEHRDTARFAVNLRGHGSIVLSDSLDALRGHPWMARPVPEVL
jgi:ribulose-5-phosphate 4-epimerase/fuculose-1-phosphate aldolase